ncbi:Putative type II restriction endonuclease [Sulfurovum sp. enrichment culture clone C5]|uniref:Putative type II restriction endonuclease n=1 Tax=Sulfurovum sp. enrichment culture clone C5 TaxID=497650 RepID=A0A0S4XN09_9BACT|nr:Putative type II restriction endonuclease [Sulfurovum sp. enrichment culture clone C5]
MDIILDNQHFKVIGTKEKITIADSFVVRQNKIGGGNGEAKLYIGQNNVETRSFFGNTGFVVHCFLMKTDLQKYLEETKAEYLMPEQPYVNKETLPNLWNLRKTKIDALPNRIDFEIIEQTQIAGPRIYVNSNDIAYKIIRELSLPNITFISVVKLLDQNGKLNYYFRLFADYFGNVEHPYVVEKEEEEIIDSNAPLEEKKQLIRARVGQGEYRAKLLAECPFCPITLISDDRLLIASHIKPWITSNDFEKTDPKNGFMLTPTFDRLFDRGFLSFTDDKRTILSPFLSNMTYSKLNISDNKIIPHLPTKGREEYLKYHRENILKK